MNYSVILRKPLAIVRKLKGLFNTHEAKATQKSEIKSESEIDDFRLRTDIFIVHSMAKTGTTSIGHALITLGLAKQDHQWHPELNDKFKVTIDDCNKIVKKYEFFDDIESEIKSLIYTAFKPFISEIADYNLFTDFPVGHVRIDPYVKKILFPKCKLIWNDREIDSWINSIKKWEIKNIAVFPTANKRWSQEQESITSQRLKNRYHIEKKRMINLQKSFPNDILIRNIDSGWSELCSFLALELPKEKFPVSNINIK